MESSPATVTAETSRGYAATAAHGSAWMTAQTVLNKLATILAGFLLARLLSPDDYGLAFFAVSVAVFAFVFPTPVMGDVLLAEQKRFQQIAGAANLVMWIAAIAMCAVLASLAIPLENFDGRAGLAVLILVAAMRPVADAVLAVANARMRIDLAYRRIAIIDGTVTLAATISSLAMAYLGAGPISLALPPVAALALRGILYWRSIRGRVDLTVRREELRPVARRYMVAGFGQYINNILLALEIVVLGLATDKTEVGLFVLAATYAIQANSVIAGQIGAVLQPIFAHVHGDAARQVGGFLRATRLLSAIAVPLSLVQAAIAVPVFQLLFEPEWTGSIAIFSVLSVAQAFVFVSAPSIALLKAQGRFRAYLLLQFAQLATAAAAFPAAVLYGGPIALESAAWVGFPVDESAGKALALACASAVVWASFCPLAVWIGGRPAGLGFGTTLRLFLEPWIATLPVMAALVGCWIGLRAVAPQGMADAATIAVLAPIAALVAIIASSRMRESTRTDFNAVVARFLKRKG
ncbi:MAG: oligosaccharide flippase family protein [Phycisphaera sp.]|nr:oligosaccharide flippase family protein [Phycisphaera sp.]